MNDWCVVCFSEGRGLSPQRLVSMGFGERETARDWVRRLNSVCSRSHDKKTGQRYKLIPRSKLHKYGISPIP